MSCRVIKVKTVEEAIRFLSDVPEARLLAGGTDLMPRRHRKLVAPSFLVCINGLPELQQVRKEKNSGIAIGAGVTLEELAKDPDLSAYPSLIEAASRVGTPQIRNQGTLGGNLLQEKRCVYFNHSISWARSLNRCYKLGGSRCYQYKKSSKCVALFCSDLAPVLISLGGSVVILGPRGKREIEIEQLYANGKGKGIQSNEILLEVKLPDVSQANRTAYIREALRGSFDFPLISCAVSLEIRNAMVHSAHVVLGAAAPHPVVVMEAEKVLTGKRVSDVPLLLNDIKKNARKHVRPFADSRIDGKTRILLGEFVIAQGVLKACGGL